MTKQLKEAVQEALKQLNKKGDGSLSEFSQYLANQSNALETLLHGLLNYIDEEEKGFDKLKIIDKLGSEYNTIRTLLEASNMFKIINVNYDKSEEIPKEVE